MKFEEAFKAILDEGTRNGTIYSQQTIRAAATAWNFVALALMNGGLEDCVKLETTPEGRIMDIRSVDPSDFLAEFIAEPVKDSGAADKDSTEEEDEEEDDDKEEDLDSGEEDDKKDDDSDSDEDDDDEDGDEK
jgi:hypothetical protein